MAEPLTEADEGFHSPGAQEQWSDSLYFGGGDGRGLAFYTRIGWRPKLAAVAAIDNDVELDPELGCQRRFDARVRDDAGREHVLHGEAVAVAPLRQRTDGRLTLINEGLTRMRWGEREGLGLSEFLVQEPAVRA